MQKSIEMIFKYVEKNISFLFCILLLVIYFFLYFHIIPVIGLCLFLCSLFFGVHIISKRSENFLINNPELFLLVCIFLYGFYNPVVAYLSDNMNNEVYKAMIVYETDKFHSKNDKIVIGVFTNMQLYRSFIYNLIKDEIDKNWEPEDKDFNQGYSKNGYLKMTMDYLKDNKQTQHLYEWELEVEEIELNKELNKILE